tara:strand:+ start:73 stop:327 length:255 start_codon:yes stop_codon:yes gene_type:complete
MKNIVVYTGPFCNFCDAAKRLLQRNGLSFDEIDISSGENIREEMIKKTSGQRTIPQIFFGDYHVGGYTELRELEKSNNLKEKLK